MRSGLIAISLVLLSVPLAHADSRLLHIKAHHVAARRAAGDTVTVVLVGDVSLNRSNTPVHEGGALAGGTVVPWDEMTRQVSSLITGDINFMNLETVVADRNDLKADRKGQKSPYSFRSHPNGVRHLTNVGFNLASLANNHSYDYGARGVLQTLHHTGVLQRAGKLTSAGLGIDLQAASDPSRVTTHGADVAFSAIGIVTNNIRRHRAGVGKPGSAAYRFDDDWKLVTRRLFDSPADFRMLSIHYGVERKVHADDRQFREWRWAVMERDVDLVIGHHAHVVRGVERLDGKLIFYGLGNFLIRGARNMGAFPELAGCRDYGLLARVHLQPAADGKLVTRAVEVVPVYDMHKSPVRFADAEQSRRRIAALNYLAERLDNKETGSVGVRFTPQADGSGLYCFPGAAQARGKVGLLCKNYRAPAPLARSLRSEVKRACERKDRKKPRKPRHRRPRT